MYETDFVGDGLRIIEDYEGREQNPELRRMLRNLLRHVYVPIVDCDLSIPEFEKLCERL